jgi:hypothetical protein
LPLWWLLEAMRKQSFLKVVMENWT